MINFPTIANRRIIVFADLEAHLREKFDCDEKCDCDRVGRFFDGIAWSSDANYLEMDQYIDAIKECEADDVLAYLEGLGVSDCLLQM